MMFSTSSFLYADRDPNSESPSQEPESPSQEPESPSQEPESPSQESESPSQESGYGTDSNRSYFEEGADAMADEPVQNIPTDHLRRYIEDTGEIVREPSAAGIDDDDITSQNFFKDRNRDLREELQRRKDRGEIPNSPAPETPKGPLDNEPSNPGNDGNDEGGGSLSTGTSGGNFNDSSSTNKRKFEEDDDNNSADTQEPKRRLNPGDGDGENETLNPGDGDRKNEAMICVEPGKEDISSDGEVLISPEGSLGCSGVGTNSEGLDGDSDIEDFVINYILPNPIHNEIPVTTEGI